MAAIFAPGQLVSVVGPTWMPSQFDEEADPSGVVRYWRQYEFLHPSGLRFRWDIDPSLDQASVHFGRVDVTVFLVNSPAHRFTMAAFAFNLTNEDDLFSEFLADTRGELDELWVQQEAGTAPVMFYEALRGATLNVQKGLGLQYQEPVTLMNLGYDRPYYAVNYNPARPLETQSIYEENTLSRLLGAPPDPIHGYRDPKTRQPIASVTKITFKLPTTAGIKRRLSIGGGGKKKKSPPRKGR